MKLLLAALATTVSSQETQWYDDASAELRMLSNHTSAPQAPTHWPGNYTDASNPFKLAVNGQLLPVTYDNWDVPCTVEANGVQLVNFGTMKKGCCDAQRTRVAMAVLANPAMASIAPLVIATLHGNSGGCWGDSYMPGPACQNATTAGGFTEHMPTAHSFLIAASIYLADDCACFDATVAGLNANTGSMHGQLLLGYGTSCLGSTSSAGYNLPMTKITTTTTTTTTTTKVDPNATTTTTTTTVPAKVTGAVSMATTVPSGCDTTAAFTGTVTTLCASVKAALDDGTCEALKANAGANASAITCGASGNFASTLSLSRRLEEARQLAGVSKTIAMDYTITVAAGADPNTVVAGIASAITTAGTTAIATAMKTNVETKIAADNSLTDMTVTSVTAQAPTAVNALVQTSVDSFAAAKLASAAALVFGAALI